MADTPTLELRIQDNSEKAIRGLQSLASSLRELKGTLEGGLGFEKVIGDLDKLSAKFNSTFTSDTVNNINKVTEALEKLQKVSDVKLPDLSYGNNNQPISPEMKPIDSPIEFAKPDLSGFDETNDEVAHSVEELEEKLAASKAELGDFSRETSGANEEIKAVAESLKKTKENADGASGGFRNFTKALGKAISPLDKVIKAFNRILFYRVIRSVIKEISKGLGEGIANVRAYSKAINGSFNTSMTAAEDALFKMKNSIGAALAPALEMLIPLLQTLVSWFVTLVNYANQFFALLSGKTEWTRAIDASAASFEKQKKAASGAAKEVKNLLAGFDELNIIQSESGGNGGGGGAAATADYTKAFEQVNQFDGRIREFVKWLKDNMQTVLTDVGAIGIAIGAWKIAEALGLQLDALVALADLAIVKIVFDITTAFDNKFLETGDEGYLVGSLLTALLGGLATYGVTKKVMGGEAATVAMSLTLAVSAAADIIANINSVDTSVLSKESLELMLTSAVKGGAAGGFLAKWMGKSAGDTVKAFGGATLVTFGVGVGLKAVAQSMQTDETAETLAAKATSSLTSGAGIALLSNSMLGLKGSQAAFFGGGAAMLMFGIETGIKSVAKAVDSGFTYDNLVEIAGESLAMGGGAALIGKSMGLSVNQAGMAGVSTAGLVFSIVTGLKAIVEARDAGVSTQTFIDTAIASLGVGVSTFGFLSALGLTAGTAGVIAGGAAIATVAAVVGVIAYLQTSREENRIHWGNEELTQEQIQAYVKEKMFTIDVLTQTNLISTKIINAQNTEAVIAEQAAEAFSTLNVLRIGVNQQESLNTLLDQILGESRDGKGGLVSSINTSIKEKKGLLELALSIMPVIDENGKNISKELLTGSNEGWGTVEDWMTDEGKKLVKLLTDPKTNELKKNLSEFEKNAVDAYITTIMNISKAVSDANIEMTMLSNLDVALSNMNEKTVREAMKLFGEYRKGLETEYTKLEYKAAADILARKNALEAIGDKEGAEKAAAQYEAYIAGIKKRVDDAVNKASASGMTVVKQTLGQAYADVFASIVKDFNLPEGHLLLEKFLANSLEDLNGGEVANEFAEELRYTLYKAMGMSKEDFDSYGFDVLAILPDSLKGSLLTKVANTYGLEIADEFAKAIGANVPEEVWKSLEEAQKKAEEKALLDRNNAKQEKAWLNDKQLAAKTAAMQAEIEEARRALLQRGADAQDKSWNEDKQLAAQVANAREAVRLRYEQLVAEIADKEKYLESVNKQIEDAEERLHTKDPLGMDALRRRGAMDELFGYEKQGGGRTGGLKGQKSETEIELENLNAALITVQKQAESLGVTLDETISGNSVEVEEVDMSPIVEPVETAADDIHKSTVSIIKDFKNLSSLDFSREMSTIEWMLTGGGSLRGRRMVMKAEGGFVGTGDMFIARESGPELVGRIGSRTAVANNDQIVQGVASGVASGQAEQNNLLRQQNDILRQLLSKSGRTEAVPSADWGQFIKRSSEMYATNAGW